MRPKHLILTDMVLELGGFRQVSKQLGVSEVTLRKNCEDPERSGKPITLKNYQDLLALAGPMTHNTNLQTHINEALEHFTEPAHRKIVSDALLTDLDRFLGALKNGGHWKPQSLSVACPQCSNEMYLIKSDQGPLYVCRDCLARVDGK